MATFTAQNLRFEKNGDQLLLFCMGVGGTINSRYIDLESFPQRISFSNNLYHLSDISPNNPVQDLGYSLGLTVTMDADNLELHKGKFSLGFEPVSTPP